MTPDNPALDRIYATHPFQKRTILARLERQGISLSGVQEPSMAIDPETEITDQNHVGGADFVAALAEAAQVGSDDTVADIGSGLGGSARLLAHTVGCRVWAIEQDPGRHEEASELTSLVGLGDRVRQIRADAIADPPAVSDVDVLWGQSAWTHFADKEAFVTRWSPVLAPGGRIALEDAYLRRPPADAAERTLLAELEHSWSASLSSLPAWTRAMEGSGCRVRSTRDLTVECGEYFSKLLRVSRGWPPGDLTDDERMGWERAVRAVTAGFLGYFRLVAVLIG